MCALLLPSVHPLPPPHVVEAQLHRSWFLFAGSAPPQFRGSGGGGRGGDGPSRQLDALHATTSSDRADVGGGCEKSSVSLREEEEEEEEERSGVEW